MASNETLRKTTKILESILDRRRREDAELRPTRTQLRNGDGTVMFRRLDGECEERAANCAVYEGQMVERPCRPGFSMQGASGLSMASTVRRSAHPWVEALDPAFPEQGFAGTVAVTGRGFTPTTVLEYLRLDGKTVNDDFTINSITFVDSENLELDIEVAEDAEILMAPVPGQFELDEEGMLTPVMAPIPLPIAYDDPGALL